MSVATWRLLTGARAWCVLCAVFLATLLLFTGAHARSAVCAVSFATRFLFIGVPARCVVLCVRCPWQFGSCSQLYPLGVFCCVSGVLGHFSPVHRCACSVCCVVCAMCLANGLLFTGVYPRCYVYAVSVATRFMFSDVLARCVVWPMQSRWPLGSYSSVCPQAVLCCVCAVLGQLSPVYRCAPAVCCVCRVLGYFAPVHRCARLVCDVA